MVESPLRSPGEEEQATARRTLAAIAVFPANEVGAARIIRLPGLTNRVFAVETSQAAYCLRIPGAGTAEFIDRRAEEHNARRAADAGLAPAVLHFGADGVMLTPLLAASPLSPEALREQTGALERAAAALRRLHDGTADFAREFQVFAILDAYLDLIEARGMRSRPDLRTLIAEAEPIRCALATRPAVRRPCHCDPTGANLLDTGERIWLIDWEYSGMNDPLWDLGYLALQADFDAGQDARLAAAYLGRPAQPAEAGRLAAQKALSELLSIIWAHLQESLGNEAADFRSYAERTTARFRARIGAEDFAVSLEAVVKG